MPSNSKPTIAIIGYGEFSKLIIDLLKPFADIVVHSRRHKPGSKGKNCSFVDVQTALRQEIIIPSMPSQVLEEFFTKNRDLVNPGALIVDVCSVKLKPVEILKRILPASIKILATHPLFGPGSAKGGIKNQKIMIFPARISSQLYYEYKNFFKEKLGLKVIECSLEQHDKSMAYVLGLSEYIGRALQAIDIPITELTTQAYESLLNMKEIQGNETWDLFYSVMRENPYSKEVSDQFSQALLELNQKLDNNL